MNLGPVKGILLRDRMSYESIWHSRKSKRLQNVWCSEIDAEGLEKLFYTYCFPLRMNKADRRMERCEDSLDNLK